MKITKIILLTIIFSFFTMQASALSFSNLSEGGNGSINSGNGYFDDENAAFNITTSRNVYTITELTQINIVEPISFVGGTSNAYQAINASSGTLYDAVIHNGYLYFIDNNVIKKKKTRGFQIPQSCEANDTSSGGCISTIATGQSVYSLRVLDNELYWMDGLTLKKLDSEDSTITLFTVPGSIPGGEARVSSFTMSSNSSTPTVYVYRWDGAAIRLSGCISAASCFTIASTGTANLPYFSSLYSTSNYFYALFVCPTCGGSPSDEDIYRVSNGTGTTVDYITTNTLRNRNRAYVSGESTVGLAMQSNISYETYNSIEIGLSSLPISEGSGIVEYVDKEIIVPNTLYYNDSTIPINVNLKFIISDTNHTNYLTTATWHLLAFDPSGLMVEDHDLPVICTQTQPWWDPFGVLSLFLVDLVTPWACDGTQTVLYSPNPGQFWANGTYTIELTEQIPGTTSILSTDSYNIVNQSSTGSGVVNPPAPCPTCGMGSGGTINVNTSLQIIQVFSFVAFWGFIIWLGVVFTVIGIMSKSPSGVNGIAVIVVAWLSAVFIALIGLFDPYKIYIIVISTIIAAVLFRLGKNATTTED